MSNGPVTGTSTSTSCSSDDPQTQAYQAQPYQAEPPSQSPKKGASVSVNGSTSASSFTNYCNFNPDFVDGNDESPLLKPSSSTKEDSITCPKKGNEVNTSTKVNPFRNRKEHNATCTKMNSFQKGKEDNITSQKKYYWSKKSICKSSNK